MIQFTFNQPHLKHKQCEIFFWEFSDEYFWEHAAAEALLKELIGPEVVDKFIQSGGGFWIQDRPNPLPRFHKISITAHHDQESWLTWIQLAKRTVNG